MIYLKKVKNSVFLSLIAMALILITACGGAGTSESDSNGSNSAKGTNNGQEKLPVRYVIPGHAPDDQKQVEEAINEKLAEDGLNIEYEAIYIPWDVWDQKTNLMMSTGEEFEIIHIMHDQKGPNVLASTGGIIPIEEYLDEYGPDLKASIPEWIWEAAKIGGEIHFVPNFWMDAAYAEGQVTMRTDILEDLNIDLPQSAEDLLDVAEELQQNWPDENKDVYIRHLKGEVPAYLHTTYDSFPFTVFEELIYVDQEGNVESWIETEEFKMNAEYFREAYNRGLVNPDILTEPIEVTNSEEELGRYLYREGEGTSNSTLGDKVEGAEIDIYYLNDKPKFRPYAVRNSNGISASTDHPEAAIEFLNWFYSDQENYDLVAYGIEGEHWSDLGPNKMEVLKRTDTGAEAYVLANWMLGSVEMSRWEPNTHPSYLETHTTVEEDAINSIALGFNFDATEVGTEYSNALAELETSIYPIKLGLVDYDEAFPNALENMKAAGLDKVVEEFENQFNEWLETQE